jgi:pyruvate dehydrogenase E2 component (dihydrolipoamide acetyltransferase)
VPVGETVPVLTVVALITRTADEDLSAYEPQFQVSDSEFRVDEAAQLATSEPETLKPETRIFASPRARRLAREKEVDLALVTGSGPKGRIVERDVVAYLETLALAPPSAPTPPAPPAPVEAVEAVAEVPMTGVRAVIAQRMHESHQTTAPVTLTTEADATAFVELRERLKASLAAELGFNIGYNDLLIKLVAHALGQFPYMNARLDGEVIRELGEIHIALAVDTDRGLLVPVIRNADRKGVAKIAREVRELVERARTGKALPDELSGSTFTITNLGMHEVDAFTPIINLPETAILGVGRIKARPAVVEGELCVRQTMWLSLTFDHRLVDGGPAARFLQYIKNLIEDPYLWLAVTLQ